MPLEPQLFEYLTLDTKQPCEGSPKDPGVTFVGILINVPTRVIRNEGGNVPTIPVCGFMRLPVSAGPTNEPMIVVEDRRTQKQYCGAAVARYRGGPFKPAPDLRHLFPAEEMEGVCSARYFNYDLRLFVSFPTEPGTYRAHVECGGYQSNVVEFQIV